VCKQPTVLKFPNDAIYFLDVADFFCLVMAPGGGGGGGVTTDLEHHR
jgi:hypothetical protein